MTIMLLITACWRPSSFPINVGLSRTLNDEQASASIDALTELNDLAERRLFKFRFVERDDVVQDGITITPKKPRLRSRIAQFRLTGRECVIGLGSVDDRRVIEHEVLHCMGFDHEDDPESIMHHVVGAKLNGDHTMRLKNLHDATMKGSM